MIIKKLNIKQKRILYFSLLILLTISILKFFTARDQILIMSDKRYTNYKRKGETGRLILYNVLVNSGKIRKLRTINYPISKYSGHFFPSYLPIIKGKEKNQWYFVEPGRSITNKRYWYWVIIKLQLFNNKLQSHIKLVRARAKKPFIEDAGFVQIDDSGRNLIFDKEGIFINLNNLSRGSYENMTDIIATRQIDKNIFVYQKKYLIHNDLYGKPETVNRIVLENIENHQRKEFDIGFPPTQIIDGHYSGCPLGISKDKKRLCFLATPNIQKNNRNEIWLYLIELNNRSINVLDKTIQLSRETSIETAKFQRILRLPVTERSSIFKSPVTSLQFKPDNNRIVAVNNPGGTETVKNTRKSIDYNLLIINVDQKKVIKKINKKIKSYRWSPSGDRIGLLDMDGGLYIWNYKSNKIKKITENKDFYDFVWVE